MGPWLQREAHGSTTTFLRYFLLPFFSPLSFSNLLLFSFSPLSSPLSHLLYPLFLFFLSSFVSDPISPRAPRFCRLSIWLVWKSFAISSPLCFSPFCPSLFQSPYLFFLLPLLFSFVLKKTIAREHLDSVDFR
jgi:hypothetical protein